VADSEVLKAYSSACWIDADIIINHEEAPSIFAAVPEGSIGAVEAWASPTVEAYKKFISQIKRNPLTTEGSVDEDAAAYYSRFGLPLEFLTVIQTGVIVFDPNAHGPQFRSVYNLYEDRGPAWWHYEMRPLSYELHRTATITWLDPRFNYNAICDLVAIRGDDWPNYFSLIDKIAIRIPWIPFLGIIYRKKIASIRNALNQAWFLHFSGFRFGLLCLTWERRDREP
jgi:hypothetical protein